MLTCKKCGAPAEQVNNAVVKSCECGSSVGIIMDMGSVKLKGLGNVSEKHSLQEVLDQLVNFILKKYKELSGKG